MSDEDMIRRGDARELLIACGLMGNHENDPLVAMFSDLPAAQTFTTADLEAAFRVGLEMAAKEAADAGYECSGCGHMCGDPDKDLAIILRAGALSCCPERKMVPFGTTILSLTTPDDLAARVKGGGK